ncbi:MAG: hypothetical protein AUJ92_16045 [Armatimonadetes bacterium CG2_30_59_28]|nr:MAG: hypothetical protein AUJ92_16045 [Armatimonadetes bacterium CG2_30_59_28]PIU62601.1 MAG: hypothetical protein COS85_18020 [Armatimonadetes bacterium CG07_land_8_20_14_0_80_59_28]PIX41332.1 MAG: hypothetical protein COZ56_12320 [Armatimonadetes bacterium CG_4_8_14_3_um_filter_58_9]PIY43439.1 MAG: hypothetical protein COZ05_11045 [Armatimonadetes bacterium CG_4_10_14_3_um_filter_59_10]PJB65611.1 MAG: hypothetical protein CO095_13865 [Armatimonadetes bacterium CG_4_9_14_3_um_filter_58_7]
MQVNTIGSACLPARTNQRGLTESDAIVTAFDGILVTGENTPSPRPSPPMGRWQMDTSAMLMVVLWVISFAISCERPSNGIFE